MIRALAVLALLLLAPPLAAQSRVQRTNTLVELLLERGAPGQPVAALIRFTPRPGWHSYWSNPGDAGAPVRLTWTLPPGSPTPPEPRYPVPETLIVSGLMNHVYSGPSALLTELVLPDGASQAISLKAEWLICSDTQCVPEDATLSVTMPQGPPDAATARAFAEARAALPRPVDWDIRFQQADGRFRLALPFPNPDEVTSAHVFPDRDGLIDYAAPQSVTITPEGLRFETASASPVTEGPVTGLVRINRGAGEPPLGFTFTARPGDIPPPGAPLKAPAPAASLLPVLALAVLGGLLLNIMPCVFPILSLKALSLAKGGISPARARTDALAYTAGTILVTTALGGMVLALRAAGEQVGWAFQLQDPRVITLLLLLVTAIALNLAGLFELNLSSGSLGTSLTSRSDALGSFSTGALSAFIATPCTGPFMAGALGAALVLPPAAGLAVFAGLGFGLALPFLAIGFVPALRRRLPRPGPWMARLRAILSVPMFLTALALAWVLGRQAGVDGMAIGLAAALLLGLFLWWLGRAQSQGRNTAVPALLALAMALAPAPFLPTSAPAATATASLSGEPYTPARLAALRAERQPVFLYMTADWCITCKVNEKGAMSSPEVAAHFRERGIKVLVGDWTRPDPAISDWLAAHGRAGIPVYVYYAPDGREQELPQLLTVAALTSLAS
jgi:DsbC/DsbD-like thiol-disulfide interchange protein/cytochrome c biogenesis protein CcdA